MTIQPGLYKIISIGTLLSLLIATSLFLSGCGSDPEPAPLSESEKVRELLTTNGGTWSPTGNTGIMVDGVDVTEDLFPGFSIKFLDQTLTTTGTTPVWLRQDTWRFKDETGKVIIRGQDDKEITITEISATQLKLSLEWSETTTEGGRRHSLKGVHEFILNK